MDLKPMSRLWTSLTLGLLCLLVLPCLAVADDDDDDGPSKSYLKAVYSKLSSLADQEDEARKPPKGGSHGGVDPTIVPVVDEDFMQMVDWTKDQIDAPEAHQRETGNGILVAVLDGGFNLGHPDVAPNMAWFGYDAIDDDDNPEDLGNGYDDDGDGYTDRCVGHGTFVAGMVLLAAPDATILPIRVRDDEGWGTDGELERGLMFAWYMGADVVNLSVSAASGDPGVLNMISHMRKAGIVVVASAGNDGSTTLGPIAASANTIAVGSVDKYDQMPEWTNYSDSTGSPVIFAPGLNLYGPLGTPEDVSSGYWSGTSFSAGLVSGAAALVLDADDEASPGDVEDYLFDYVDGITDPNGYPVSGTGRINLYETVRHVDD